MRIRTPCLIMLSTLVWPSMGLADISFNNGAWNTSFDYAQECSVVGATGVNCHTIENDGINWNVGARPRGGNNTSARLAANNPNGKGGMGARFWTNDGSNQNTIEIRINFPSQEPEFWMRWYQRYESGYQWSGGEPNYDKCFYMWSNGPGQASGMWILPEFGASQDTYALNTNNDNRSQSFEALSPLITWTDVFGNTSDGLFHMFEIHVKTDTDQTDGIVQVWIDGVKYVDSSTINYSDGIQAARDGISRMDFHQNQSSVSNGRVMYVDYDDIEIYKTTPPQISPDGDPWIGPLNGFSGAGSLPRPNQPSSVGVSFYDSIEDNNLASGGSYDKANMVLANSRPTSRSTKTIEYRFNSSATQAVR